MPKKREELQDLDAYHSTIWHMGINHGGFYIAMPKQLLNRAYSVASLGQMGSPAPPPATAPLPARTSTGTRLKAGVPLRESITALKMAFTSG